MPVDPMDPSNPITALCIQGMEAEGRGDTDRARALFQQAWDEHTTSTEAAVAAHYLARHQASQDQTCHWNQRALDAALTSAPNVVAGMLPSLHLNLGRSHEDAGLLGLARHYYEQARDASHVLGDDGYGQMTRNGIAAALERTRPSRRAAREDR